MALYYNDLTNQNATQGRLITAHLGIRWGHVTAGLTSPTDDIFVKLAFEGAKRIASKTTVRNQKEPITGDMLMLAVQKYGQSKNLNAQRFLVISLLSFAAFLRVSELRQMQIPHQTT